MDAAAEIGGNPVGKHQIQPEHGMRRLTRDGTTEPVSRYQSFRRERGQGNIHFPCSADHEQDWQPYPVDSSFAICDYHTYIHTYIYIWLRAKWFDLYRVTLSTSTGQFPGLPTTWPT